MKIRSGFVSNSSSSSFVINMENMPEELKNKIMKLKDRSNDLTRCTGKITNIAAWLGELEEDDHCGIKKFIGNPSIIIIKESDEAMGGEFADYEFILEDIEPYVIKKFEYH
jgi:hypothetical protein